MKLSDLTTRGGEWLGGTGPMQDVVISSRVRLARNIAGVPFLSRCDKKQTTELADRIHHAIVDAVSDVGGFYVDVGGLDELDRELLVERHLISRHHADADHPRGVWISENETIAIMVNEEDHLRIQVLSSGLEFQRASNDSNRIDDLLEQHLEYAFHEQYGYLTACPTNVGTGLRVSVMLHLPALKMTEEIEKAFRAARDMRLAIRGLYGEGTEASGDFFQISNHTTLGKSEEQIIEEFCTQILPQFIDYERRARRSLVRRRQAEIDDKVFRSLGLLRAARTISSEETMYLLSLVRLGINLGRVEGIELKTVNELFLQTQPAHLQKFLDRRMSPLERSEARADYIHRRIGT